MRRDASPAAHLLGAGEQDLLPVQREEIRALPHLPILVMAGVQGAGKRPPRRDDDGFIRDIQTQCIAIGDGVDYDKCELNPVLTGKDLGPHSLE